MDSVLKNLQVNTECIHLSPKGLGRLKIETAMMPNKYPRRGLMMNCPTYPAAIATGFLNASTKSVGLEFTPTANIRKPSAGA